MRWLALLLLVVFPALAHADQVDDLVAVLGKKPRGTSDAEWREQRRAAARELGRLGDRRAVEPLMKIAEAEKLDAVAEIAIDALGKLGDPRAVPVLQRIAADEGRDAYLRAAAHDALAALGQPAEPEPPVAEPPAAEPPAAETPVAETPVAGPAAEPSAAPAAEPEPVVEEEPIAGVELPATSRFAPDVLAQSERWTFAAGRFALTWDSIADQPQGSGSGSLFYRRNLEKPELGYSLTAGLALAGGAQDRNGDLPDTASYALAFAGVAESELRFYLAGARGVFLHAGVSLALAGSAITVEADTGEDFKEFTPSLDAGLLLGAGYGRTLEVGSKLRVARLERVLRRARLLGRPINADVAARLQTAWWDARGSLGFRRELAATVAILREAGVLLTDPDASTTYQLLAVIADAQLDERRQGWDARVGLGELLVGRDNVDEDDNFDTERQEVALFSATYAEQLDDGLAELVGEGRGVYRVTGEPGYVAVAADVTYRRFFYGEAWDPSGALELGLELGASDSDLDEQEGQDDRGAAARAAVRAGYRVFFARASHVGATASLRREGDATFLGIVLDGTWGLSSASFTAW